MILECIAMCTVNFELRPVVCTTFKTELNITVNSNHSQPFINCSPFSSIYFSLLKIDCRNTCSTNHAVLKKKPKNGYRKGPLIFGRRVDLSKSLGGSNLITRSFLAKFCEFCLHCLYIVNFVCNIRTSQ